MTSPHVRQPKGIPTGGQFAAVAAGEQHGLALEDPAVGFVEPAVVEHASDDEIHAARRFAAAVDRLHEHPANGSTPANPRFEEMVNDYAIDAPTHHRAVVDRVVGASMGRTDLSEDDVAIIRGMRATVDGVQQRWAELTDLYEAGEITEAYYDDARFTRGAEIMHRELPDSLRMLAKLQNRDVAGLLTRREAVGEPVDGDEHSMYTADHGLRTVGPGLAIVHCGSCGDPVDEVTLHDGEGVPVDSLCDDCATRR